MKLRLSTLHLRSQLSIAIMDVSSIDDLENTIAWYSKNMNFLIHIITTQERYDLYEMGEKYPEITYLCFKSLTTVGEMINVFSCECTSTYFFITRSDVELIAFEGKSLISFLEENLNIAVISPVMLNINAQLIQTLKSPAFEHNRIEVVTSLVDLEKENTNYNNLYPILGIGLYNRALFQRLRGYDEEILSQYYQELDFGLKTHLLGYNIYTNNNFVIRFNSKCSIMENKNDEEGIKRCYTRALSIHRVAGKNAASKPKLYVDKKLYKSEIKKKQVTIQKIDFETLVKEWKQ